jgi:hypothetical protein
MDEADILAALLAVENGNAITEIAHEDYALSPS